MKSIKSALLNRIVDNCLYVAEGILSGEISYFKSFFMLLYNIPLLLVFGLINYLFAFVSLFRSDN